MLSPGNVGLGKPPSTVALCLIIKIKPDVVDGSIYMLHNLGNSVFIITVVKMLAEFAGLNGFVWNSPDPLSFCEERSLFLKRRPKNRSFIGEDEPIIAIRGVTADESTR